MHFVIDLPHGAAPGTSATLLSAVGARGHVHSIDGDLHRRRNTPGIDDDLHAQVELLQAQQLTSFTRIPLCERTFYTAAKNGSRSTRECVHVDSVSITVDT